MAVPGLTPWHTLVAALWASLTCGFLYTFSTFSEALQVKFNLSHADLETIGMCQLLTGLFTFTAGLLVDRIGVGKTLLTGCLVNSGSWLFFGLIANGFLPSPAPLPSFSALIALSTWGGAATTGPVFATLSKNFQGRSAAPIGIAKAWVGASAGIATTLYVSFFPSEGEAPARLNYIFFLSASCALFVLVPLPFIRVLNFKGSGGGTEPSRDALCVPVHWRVRLLMLITLALVALTATAVLLRQVGVSHDLSVALGVAILAVVASPVMILCPRGAQQGDAKSPKKVPPLLGADAARSRPTSPWASGPGEMLRRLEAWLLWLVIFALLGGGVLLTTNLGSMTRSRSGPEVSAASAVATFSCCQSLGRLCGGALSDLVVHRRVARPWCFALLTLLMAAAHGVLCVPGPAALFGGVALAGWAFGSTWPLLILTIAELFGTERIASNYMVFDGSPSALAGLLLAKLLAQSVYTANAQPGGEDGAMRCTGDRCYRLTHAVVVCLELVATLAAALLAIRAKEVYSVSVWCHNDENEVEDDDDTSTSSLGSNSRDSLESDE